MVVSSTSPPAWHPDPQDPTMLRWWDGTSWTEHRHPATDPGAGATPQASPGAQPGYGAAQPDYGAPQPGYGARPGYGNSPVYGAQGGFSGQGGYGAQQGFPAQQSFGVPTGPVARGQSGPTSWRAGNSNSVIVFIAGAIYLALALLVHFVFIGIVPVVYTIRAFQRQEKLAPIAAVVAATVVITAIIVLGHH